MAALVQYRRMNLFLLFELRRHGVVRFPPLAGHRHRGGTETRVGNPLGWERPLAHGTPGHNLPSSRIHRSPHRIEVLREVAPWHEGNIGWARYVDSVVVVVVVVVVADDLRCGWLLLWCVC